MRASPSRRAAAAVVVLGALLTHSLATAQGAGSRAARDTTERVSVSSSGTEGNARSFEAALSADGRYVAFVSLASNLVPGDDNRTQDVFVRDRVAGTTRLVSVAATGSPANLWSGVPDISADGRYVVFQSNASDLVAGDTNNVHDVFVRDLRSGTTKRVSVSAKGAQANLSSFNPTISADGRYVAFDTHADNLISSSKGFGNIYVRDLRTGALELVSVNSREVPGNGGSYDAHISATGRFVSFDAGGWRNFSQAPRLSQTDVYLRDLLRGTTRLVSTPAEGEPTTARDERASFSCGVSASGRYVAFESFATDLVPGGTQDYLHHVYLRDMRRGTTWLVDRDMNGVEAVRSTHGCRLSSDGRFVVFTSPARNLVPSDANHLPDVFVWNRRNHRIVRVSINNAGDQTDEVLTPGIAISANDRVVAFASLASNLVGQDTNHQSDVFVRDQSSD